jgi:hypothetical protein
MWLMCVDAVFADQGVQRDQQQEGIAGSWACVNATAYDKSPRRTQPSTAGAESASLMTAAVAVQSPTLAISCN